MFIYSYCMPWTCNEICRLHKREYCSVTVVFLTCIWVLFSIYGFFFQYSFLFLHAIGKHDAYSDIGYFVMCTVVQKAKCLLLKQCYDINLFILLIRILSRLWECMYRNAISFLVKWLYVVFDTYTKELFCICASGWDLFGSLLIYSVLKCGDWSVCRNCLAS